ncbi:MAG: UDP-N-acetylmuramoyl-L-alanine--D-glutamate ligase [Actinomycetota bacterium]|nr:UDP-N-acetylmuramoyl-L-alanine--D-glutamate ligase [Actinomycetota bacterium]
MLLSDLTGRRVAVWGAGLEGRAAATVIARRRPADLVVVEDGVVAADVLATDDGAQVPLRGGDDGRAALGDAEVIVRSPGISRYRPDVAALAVGPATMTTSTGLFLAHSVDVPVVGITGTKGKSTTASLIAALLDAVGRPAVLAGNIGAPMLPLLDQEIPAEVVRVVEVSSYQAADVTASPSVGVLTSLWPEHLDWHGGWDRYVADKLNLFAHRPDLAVAVGTTTVSDEAVPGRVVRFGTPPGWWADGTALCRGETPPLLDTAGTPVRGSHIGHDLAGAVTALELLGVDVESCARELARAVATWEPLPHRQTVIAERDGVRWVDDTLATVPQATAAAVEVFLPDPVTLLVGGFDRGIDYTDLGAALARWGKAVTVVTMPDTGAKVAAAVRAAPDGADVELHESDGIDDAVAIARHVTATGGTILLSPAAPSYHRFKNYTELAARFAELVAAD